MAETVISAVVETIFQQLGSLALREIGMAWGIKDQLIKLKNTLSTVKAVLVDAEEQQASNHEVKDWLGKLKDAAYDADDVLDEFLTEDLRRQVEIRGSIKNKVRYFFSRSNPLAFTFKMGHKLKEIRDKLDEIAANRRNFHFMEHVSNTHIGNKVREETEPFIISSDVIGRDGDKMKIVELLVGSSDVEHISVIPIVGIGGLGKTALSQLVYNDERVVSHFNLRIWVHVSEEFNLKTIITKILRSATSTNFGDLSMDQLRIELRNNLDGRKFLLVLDDVWNEDNDEWVRLKSLLTCCARGSKILVTTRSERVASIMGNVGAYHLKALQEDDCWSLFRKCAFREGEENMHSRLVKIGKNIVKKCGGVPLAARTLGSMLFMNVEVRDWLYVENNEIWRFPQKKGDILPILRLSYDLMPSYLKECFAYCSIFPKNYAIIRQDLISLWIAQGYIQSVDGSKQLEDIGNQYFNELLARSFFQDVNKSFDSQVTSCKMHNLVVDLARSVAGSEWMIIDSKTNKISERVRHLLFRKGVLSGQEFPSYLEKVEKVRSLNFLFSVGPLKMSYIEQIIMKFKSMRVLDLSTSEFEELPSCIGQLKHLRLLRLNGNKSIKTLPNSICKLLNLQSLDLYGCQQFKEFPKDIGKLINLRKLDLTSEQLCLPEKGLQGWTSLRFLLLSKCKNLTSLSEGMQHLTALQNLTIRHCPMLSSLPSNMKCLTSLKKLVINDCQELDLLNEDELMNSQWPLQSLSIVGLPKLVALPNGIQKFTSTLQYLNVRNCPNLATLPLWLKNLTSLRALYIMDCPNVLSLPRGMDRLTALHELNVKGCPHLSRRCKPRTGADWAKISHVPKIYRDRVVQS